MLIKKQDIKYLPLQDIADLEIPQVGEWCESVQFSHLSSWSLAQMLAHFGTWKVAKTEGQFDVLETLKQNIQTKWDRGLWKLTRVKRALLMPKQIAQAEYGSFTPLILAGLKKMQGIPYEKWRGCGRLSLIMEAELHDAVVLDDYSFCDLGSDRLLELRAQGLVTQSGKTAGKVKSAESTWALAGLQGTELDKLPKWTQTMVTQCWLAHPKHRSQYMILDPQNWDRMPEPLLSSEIFSKPVEKLVVKKAQQHEELPF